MGRKALVENTTPQRRSSTSFEFRQVRRALATEEPPKKPTVLKDLDFTRQLHVGPDNKAKVLNQLAIDCKVCLFSLIILPLLLSLYVPIIIFYVYTDISIILVLITAFVDGLQSSHWSTSYRYYYVNTRNPWHH